MMTHRSHYSDRQYVTGGEETPCSCCTLTSPGVCFFMCLILFSIGIASLKPLWVTEVCHDQTIEPKGSLKKNSLFWTPMHPVRLPV